MNSHPQKFRIIGFLDAGWKWRGTAQTTRFRPEHCFVLPHIPTQERLKIYATEHGYWPSRKIGASPTKCEPVYEMIGEGLDYTNCAECFPPTETTDNRAGPE